MTVMVALDGASAMRIVDQITPDIVLLDAVMPGMDGFETCRRLKRDAGLDGVPIIFMTGLAETEHIVRGLEAGGVDYVTKPIVIEEMLARIRVHLANARMTQSARAALDVSGRYLLAVNSAGKLLWATPQAQKLLSDTLADADDDFVLARPDAAMAGAGAEGQGRTEDRDHGVASRQRAASAAVYGQARRRTNSCCGWPRTPAATRPRNSPASSASPRREGEVLSWLSKGKTNRDIAQILGLSPRTVDKHLEQIYSKLGVENRTAAAAIAVNATQRQAGDAARRHRRAASCPTTAHALCHVP